MAWISGSVFFDGPNKLIIASGSTSVLRVTQDLYSDWKEWIVDTGSNSRFHPAFAVIGGQPTGNKFAGSIFFLINGWKIRPDERTHELTLDGNLFTDDGTALVSPITGAFTVTIVTNNSNLAQGISTPVLSVSQSNQIEEVWKIHGLDPTNPMSVSDTLRTVADIVQNIILVNNTASISRV